MSSCCDGIPDNTPACKPVYVGSVKPDEPGTLEQALERLRDAIMGKTEYKPEYPRLVIVEKLHPNCGWKRDEKDVVNLVYLQTGEMDFRDLLGSYKGLEYGTLNFLPGYSLNTNIHDIFLKLM